MAFPLFLEILVQLSKLKEIWITPHVGKLTVGSELSQY